MGGAEDQGPIAPPGVVGIIGGGQLGRMSALAARAMGYRVVVLEPKTPCACGPVADEQIAAAYDDPGGLERLFSIADVVTFEFENVPKAPLEAFARRKPVRPSPEILSVAQNRRREKEFLAGRGFPVAPFRVIESAADAEAAAGGGVAFPAILKTADFGYDGKGQVVVGKAGDLAAAWAGFGGGGAVLEEKIDFRAEYSVIVARGPSGAIATYPLCRNIHRNHILDVTFSPVPPGEADAAAADAICRGLAEALGLEGVLAVELFLGGDGRWIINEMAPRPHNSGHFSIDGSDTSQFENHIRAVCGQPLGSPEPRAFSVMQNLLGEELNAAGAALAETVLSVPGAHLHLYDKGEARAGRKMGHVTICRADAGGLPGALADLRAKLGLPPPGADERRGRS
ncbi:MAG: 5-(carboxyamino)imidazole ribonucleotide synthase [Puniceicoccaceae bacterium]